MFRDEQSIKRLLDDIYDSDMPFFEDVDDLDVYLMSTPVPPVIVPRSMAASGVPVPRSIWNRWNSKKASEIAGKTIGWRLWVTINVDNELEDVHAAQMYNIDLETEHRNAGQVLKNAGWELRKIYGEVTSEEWTDGEQIYPDSENKTEGLYLGCHTASIYVPGGAH